MSQKLRFLLVDGDEGHLDDLVDQLGASPRWQPLDDVDAVFARLGDGVDAILSPDSLARHLLRGSQPLIRDDGPRPPRLTAMTPGGRPSERGPPRSGWEGAFHRLAERCSDGVFTLSLSPSLQFEYLNPALSRLTGFAPRVLREHPEQVRALFSRRDLERLRRTLRDLSAPRLISVELLPRHSDALWVDLQLIPVFDERGRRVAVEGIARPVARTPNGGGADPATSGVSLAIEAIRGVWEWDLSCDAVSFSADWFQGLGFADDAFGGSAQVWLDHIHPEDRADTEARLRHHASSSQPHQICSLDYRLRCGDGAYRRIGLKAIRQHHASLTLTGTQVDQSGRDRQPGALRPAVQVDALTGLPTGRAFNDRADRLLNDPSQALVFIAVVLDHFALLNDALGHAFGDRLLGELTSRVLSSIQNSDMLARLDQDTLGLLLTSPRDLEDPVRAVERLQAQINAPFALDGHEVHLSASVAVSLRPDVPVSCETLMHTLRAELEQVEGSGRVVFI